MQKVRKTACQWDWDSSTISYEGGGGECKNSLRFIDFFPQMAHTKHSMFWTVVLRFIKLWSDLATMPPFRPTKETSPRMLGVFCCYDVASLSPNKRTLSKKDTAWLLPLPTFHPTKRNLSKDLCFLLLLPTIHLTKETWQRILCVYCRCCQHFTQQQKYI